MINNCHKLALRALYLGGLGVSLWLAYTSKWVALKNDRFNDITYRP